MTEWYVSLVAYWEFNWGLAFYKSIAAGALGLGLIALSGFRFFFLFFSYPL